MNNDRQTDCKTGIKHVKRVETCIVKNQGTCFEKFIDIALTLRARDWKGFDNYGSNGVIEVYELDGE